MEETWMWVHIGYSIVITIGFIFEAHRRRSYEDNSKLLLDRILMLQNEIDRLRKRNVEHVKNLDALSHYCDQNHIENSRE